MLLPGPVPFCQQLSSSCHDPCYHGFLLCGHPTIKERSFLLKLVIQVGGPERDPLACSKSVSSASLATEGQSKYHPLLKFSFVPPSSSEWSKKVSPSSLVLKWMDLSGPCCPMLLLSPGNEKTADKHKITLKKEQIPNHKWITGMAGMGQGVSMEWYVTCRVPRFGKELPSTLSGHPWRTQR